MRDSLMGELRRWSLVLPAVVLAVSVSIQGAHFFRSTPRTKQVHLASSLPLKVAGWTGRDVPLGPSEFLASEAEKVLNYDDVLNRQFTRGGRMFGVYVAYWGAGKMPTRLVASHTPDRCWTENGWRCLEMKFKQRESLDGSPLQPAEWRRFESPNGEQTYVMYWHLVDGSLYDYGERFNAIPDPVRWWKDAVQQVFLGSREQYFIRITSNEPIETLWHDPGFERVLHGLADLGLSIPATPSAARL